MSVYQTSGRPLSQQALYQQKLRQGVYSIPSAPSVGVSSNASDAAALLAALLDLTVKPSYERLQAAPEAYTAAVAARKELIQAWKRESTDPLADSAALLARLSTPSVSKPDLGIPAYNLASVYRQASANSTLTMTSRTTPEKSVMKHGLASKPLTATALNIGKISQVADANSSKTLNNRFNPEQDYRSGLPTALKYLTPDEEKMAAQLAGRSLSMRHGAGYLDSVSAQKRTNTFRAADVVDATLLAAATTRAQARLQSLNSTVPSDLKEQARLYSKALATAQRNSDERLKAHKVGEIDLGGGLKLPMSEIDKLAALIVQPVLKDIEAKATTQRGIDEEQRVKHAENVKKHQVFKMEALATRQHEKLDREEATRARVEANELKKRGEDETYAAYQGERNTEVSGKSEDLRLLQEKFAGEKEVLLKEKQDNEDRITEEETGLIAGRREELDGMQTERDELLAPTLAELKEETAKLKELTDAKTELSTEVDTVDKLHTEYEAKVAELKAKLEETAADIEKYTGDVAEATEKHETTDREVAELTTAHADVIAETDQSHKELDEQLAQLELEKDEHTKTKAAHKLAILLEIDDKVKDEHKINKELPDHLQLELDESRFKDTGSLFTVELVKQPVAEAPKLAAALKASAAPVAAVDPKKRGFRSRMSSIKNAFKTPPAPTPVKATPKAAPATVGSTLQRAESKKSVNTVASKSTSVFDEELSIGETPSKKGGLFKEEI